MSNEEEFDQWDLASGLGLDDVDVDVTAAEFVFNNQLGPNLALALTFTPRDGEEAKKQHFTMGPGWVAVDGGRRAASESGEPKKISQSSNYGIWLASVGKAVGPEAARQLGNPLNADTWMGTGWHVDRTKRNVMNPETGVEKESTVVIAISGLEGKAGAAKTDKPAKEAKPAKANAAKADSVEAALPALTKLAQEHDDEDEFVTAAAQLDVVKDDRAVQRLLYSDGFHASLRAAA